MPLVPLKSVLGQATREGFADGAFNVVNLDHGKSVESVKRAIKHGFIAEEEAIRLGIRKVNYYTEMAMAAFGTIKARLHAAPAEYGPGHSDYPLLFKAVKESVAQEVASRMAVYGSVGKALLAGPTDRDARL